MQSPFYKYYYIAKKDLSDHWSTLEIEQFITNTERFESRITGLFVHKEEFLTIGLMMVKSHDSWSSRDYSEDKTNYISIVTSTNVHPETKQFLADLVNFMASNVIEEVE